jgi:hypothetical protein
MSGVADQVIICITGSEFSKNGSVRPHCLADPATSSPFASGPEDTKTSLTAPPLLPLVLVKPVPALATVPARKNHLLE